MRNVFICTFLFAFVLNVKFKNFLKNRLGNIDKCSEMEYNTNVLEAVPKREEMKGWETMKTIMRLAHMKAADLGQMIVRMDIQYNFMLGEYVAYVDYTDGSRYSINDRAQVRKIYMMGSKEGSNE